MGGNLTGSRSTSSATRGAVVAESRVEIRETGDGGRPGGSVGSDVAHVKRRATANSPAAAHFRLVETVVDAIRRSLRHPGAGRDPMPVSRAQRRVRGPGPNSGAGSGDPAYNDEMAAFSLVGGVPSRGVDGSTCRHRAGIQWWNVGRELPFRPWIAACAGMTSNGKRRLLDDRQVLAQS